MANKAIFNDDAVFKKNPDLQIIKTDEGIVISRSDLKDDTIYYLDNPVSFKIWELIDSKKSIREIKENILYEYDIAENKLEEDLKEFIAELRLKNLICNDKK